MADGNAVLLDTGVLVAAFHRKDPLHERAVRGLSKFSGTAVTCWPVLTEAIHLLGKTRRGVEGVITMCASPDLATIAHIETVELRAIVAWMKKFADQRPDFADACLVHLAQREGIRTVLTFDSDFYAYRTASGMRLETPLLL